MTDVLTVLMGDEVAGTLRRLPDRRLRFDYDPGYTAGGGAIPLSLSMPTPVASHPDGVITPWLWGLLPENDAVLSRWGREFQVSTSSPFTLLATAIGDDCAGAVRFCKPDAVEAARARPGSVTWLTEEEVAARLRELRTDTTAWLGTTFTGQFSLAGAQAKTALLHEDGKWGVPSGSRATSHILKPAIAGLDDHHLNEHLCMAAAARVGLVVARSRVVRFADESAVAVDRYDRLPSTEGLVRIHQEDLAQALGIHPAQKYQADGGPAPADIVRLFERAMPGRVADVAVRRFVDALAWNWIIAGTDAHGKNYSLLFTPQGIDLAPFYDIASGLPYTNDPMKLKLAMKLGDEYRLKAHRAEHWAKAAKECGLAADEVRDRVVELAVRAPDAFRDAAASPDVTAVDSELPDRLVDAVARRAASCAAVLRA